MFAALLLSNLVGLALASPFFSHNDISQLFDRSQLLSSGCSTTGTQSCHNTSLVSNLCCFEAPGGLLLQTQFWDTNPSTGPTDSWTIHVLLTNNGASDTLAFMQTHWVDINGQNEQFWEHEWSTHGTCMSTLEPSCLPSGSVKGAEAVAFFQTVVKLFQHHGTFTLSQLTSALKTQSGFTPALDCTSGALNQISWYFNLKGSIIDGTFVLSVLLLDAPETGSCPSSGIKYPPKSGSPSSTTRHNMSKFALRIPWSFLRTNDFYQAPGSLPTKGTIHAIQSGSTVGGLLSAGTWSTQTLATYTFSGTASSFTLTSSKGNCGVSGGSFSCGSGVSSTSFSAVTSGSNLLLASGGSTSFTSDGVPSGTTVFTVFTGTSHADDYTLSIISS
ncbi:ribonuclease T2-like protein [Flammula alnicola]|nr:ribonuclease T2-like protein [Flammula alnicola]